VRLYVLIVPALVAGAGAMWAAGSEAQVVRTERSVGSQSPSKPRESVRQKGRKEAPRSGRASGARKTAAAGAAAGAIAAARSNVISAKSTEDGAAEARLIEVYRLVGQGRGESALRKAEELVRDHPNFQLAQLVYGDLLSSRTRSLGRFGDVPDALAFRGATTLVELREESQLRLRALRERPPIGSVPAQFLQLSARVKHAIAVDTSRSRLYLLENNSSGTRLIADYYISVGKLGIEKQVEGDQRTPLGVYFITSNLDPASLRDFYGSGALPINYPNPLDISRGKTGSGIWLHGSPPNQFARAPRASDGCVVLANPDLERLLRTVEIRTTPVVIAQSLRWVLPNVIQADRKPFEDQFEAWRRAKSSGDLTRTLAHYHANFSSNGRSLREWTPLLKQELSRAGGQSVNVKDLSIIRWTDHADVMVVTFGEVLSGARTGAVKRQYWIREGSNWKVFFEGVIG
jgi:L,D-transpeptidase YnhG